MHDATMGQEPAGAAEAAPSDGEREGRTPGELSADMRGAASALRADIRSARNRGETTVTLRTETLRELAWTLIGAAAAVEEATGS